MRGSRQDLVKVVLFQLRGRGQPQDDATPNFFADYKRPIKFQMRYHLFQKFFGKMVKIKEMSFLSTRGMGLMFGNCRSCFSASICWDMAFPNSHSEIF